MSEINDNDIQNGSGADTAAEPSDAAAAAGTVAETQTEASAEASADTDEAAAVADKVAQAGETAKAGRADAVCDEFSKIDGLITTPENLEEYESRLAEAEAEAQRTLEAACEARKNAVRLRRMVDYMKGQIVETATPEKETAEEEKPEAEVPTTTETTREKADAHDEPTEHKDRKGLVLTIITIVALLVVIIACIYPLIGDFSGQDSQKDSSKADTTAVTAPKKELKKPVEETAQPADTAIVSGETAEDEAAQALAEKAREDSIAKAAQAKAETVVKHRVKAGETLTKISMKYYSTKDSVRAIVRKNKICNPDNVPEGCILIMP